MPNVPGATRRADALPLIVSSSVRTPVLLSAVSLPIHPLPGLRDDRSCTHSIGAQKTCFLLVGGIPHVLQFMLNSDRVTSNLSLRLDACLTKGSF